MKNILVVDNHPLLLRLMTDLLVRRGYSVRTAQDGLAALDVLAEFTPDIIFLDLIMPNIPGEKLCRIIRSRPRFSDTYQAMRTTGGALRVEVCETRLDDAFLARHPELSSKHCIAITVGDTGSGIEPDHLGRIFEPYFTTKGPSEGTGLGLAIVHGIVKNHNGLITVTSELGKGTRFTVYLPAHQELKSRESEEVVFPLPNLHGSVMFVDDEADIAEMVRTALSKTGASVASFTDSLAAFKAFEDTPEAFDVVITDQDMPHLSGLELARKILARRPDIPVILCTGFSETLNDQGIGSTAIRQLLEKPLNIDKLAWLIKNSLPEKK